MQQQYQPRWLNGQEVGTGLRKAAPRYEAIAKELGEARDFTVLDLGAYNGYFSLRLAEDFNATCTAVDDYKGLPAALAEAADERVSGVYHRLTQEEFYALPAFDVILCLSVLHHIPWWEELLAGLRDKSKLLFVETASASEVLPKAIAHCPEIPEAVGALDGARVIAKSHGYKSKKIRPLYAIGSLA
jgi:2-polyprenyl-3-methyl-5-hydroxy-6-metoxy-1,4-benzoquinol methylase